MADTDTAPGRPARHERPPVRRAEPSRFAERGWVNVDISASVDCATEDCSRKVKVEAKGTTMAPIARVIERQARGEMPVYCKPCEEAREQAERDAELAELVATRSKALPRKWRAVAWTDLDDADIDAQRDARAAAREWGEGKRRKGLFLHGPVGRGKTMIAAAACRERMGIQPVRWLSVADLLLDLRMPFDSPEYARAIRSIEAHGKADAALVLDDIDKFKPSEHATQPIYVAINGWVEADLPLIVTSNRTLTDLADWMPEGFGEAIASRLAEHCDVFEVGGRDRRIEP